MHMLSEKSQNLLRSHNFKKRNWTAEQWQLHCDFTCIIINEGDQDDVRRKLIELRIAVKPQGLGYLLTRDSIKVYAHIDSVTIGKWTRHKQKKSSDSTDEKSGKGDRGQGLKPGKEEPKKKIDEPDENEGFTMGPGR